MEYKGNEREELLYRLNNPQDGVRYVCISGQKGKTSVGAVLESILTCAGFKTGWYTADEKASVKDDDDRVRGSLFLGGKQISREDWMDSMDQVLGVCRKMKMEGLSRPKETDRDLAAACLYFSRQGCDIVIWEEKEEGLSCPAKEGQILCTVISFMDSQNPQNPSDSYQAIAKRAAKRMRSETPVILASMNERIGEELAKRAEMKNASVRQVDIRRLSEEERPVQIAIFEEEEGIYQYFNYKYLTGLWLPMRGEEQRKNAAAAIEAAEALRDWGLNITQGQIKKGLRQAILPGSGKEMRKFTGRI